MKAGQLELPDSYRYGVLLSADFWEFLQETRNQLVVPLELLRLFVDRPTGWDYLCFLVARCGAARRASKVPHEALVSLFRDTEKQSDRNIIRRLKRYHAEIMVATGGRLRAELVEDGHFPAAGHGRPRKRWALVVRPSKSVIVAGKVIDLEVPAE